MFSGSYLEIWSFSQFLCPWDKMKYGPYIDSGAKNDKKQDHFPFPNFKSLKKESVHRHPSISAKTFPDQLKPVQTHWSRYRPIKTNPDPLKSIQRNWDPFRPMEKTHCNQSRHNEICPETLKPFQTHWVNKCGWDLMVWMGFRGCEHVWVGLDRFQLVLTGFSGSGCFQSCYMGFSGYGSFSVGLNGLEIGVDWSGFRGCGSASIGMHGI